MATPREITRQGKKVWQTTVELGPDPLTGKRRQKRVTAATKTALKSKVTKIEGDVASGKYAAMPASEMTVAVLAERWMRASQARESTRYTRQSILRKHIVPAFGAMKIAALTPLMVQEWTDGLRASLAPDTVSRYHDVLHVMCAWAVERGIIDRNPAIKRRSKAQPKRARLVWDGETVRAFLKHIRGDVMETLFRVALASQCRIGELLLLTWGDVDFDGGAITISKTLTRTLEGKWEEGPVKGGSKGHRIDLDASTIAALAEERVRWIAVHGQVPALTSLVWPGPTGEFRHEAPVLRHFNVLVRQAGVSRITVHDLRHTGATLLLRANVHPKIVSERLGHSSISITMDRYSHVLPSMGREAAEKLGQVFDPESTDG